jgi:hypothetical protein
MNTALILAVAAASAIAGTANNASTPSTAPARHNP